MLSDPIEVVLGGLVKAGVVSLIVWGSDGAGFI